MSSIIHKVKDAVTHKKSGDHTDHHDNTNYESTQSSNHGPHDSNVANTADPRVDSDRSAHNTTSTSHTSQPLSTGASHNESGLSSNHGPHDSNVANAADPRVDSDRSAHNTTSHSSTGPLGTGVGSNAYESGRSSNHGPHDSNVANAADPRVDSDRSAHNTTSHSSTGGLGAGVGAGAGANAYESGRSSNHGPHDSNIANTADPRVDSDRNAYGTGSTGLNTTSHSGSTGLNSGSHTGSTGLHSGSVGSTGLDGARTGSTGLNSGSVGSTGLDGARTGSTGYGSAAPLSGTGHNTHDTSRSSNFGPHDSNLGNKADPRVDSDLDSRHGSTGLNTGSHSGSASYGSAAPLSGGHNSASHTSANDQENLRSSNHGPHSSNLANKADPRVDSDRSKGYDFNNDVHKGSLAGEADMMHLSHSSGPDTTTRTFEEAHETGAAGTGAGSSYNHGRTSHSTAGPHDSNVANKADPRVDSDLDGSNTVGHTQTQRI